MGRWSLFIYKRNDPLKKSKAGLTNYFLTGKK